MNFIDKDNDPLAVYAAAFRLLHDRSDVLDPARHRREIDKSRLCPCGDDLCKRCLADSRRSPENHRGDMVTLDQAAQHLALTEEMLLPDKFFE